MPGQKRKNGNETASGFELSLFSEFGDISLGRGPVVGDLGIRLTLRKKRKKRKNEKKNKKEKKGGEPTVVLNSEFILGGSTVRPLVQGCVFFSPPIAVTWCVCVCVPYSCFPL